ncbi:TPA: hypothetical protein ACNMQ1_003413 [Klebsiella pneumoniae]
MKTCVFCGKSSQQVQITKEHILPKWMKNVFPHDKHFSYSSNYTGKKSVRREIKGITSFDMVVSQVCKDCNNGWMSAKLEGPLKEVLTKLVLSENIILDQSTLKLLCLWAFKTSIVRALIDNGETNIPSEYYAKAAKLEIPEGCSVYIADRGWNNDFYYTRYTTLGMHDKPGFICAIEIRALVFFVICSDYPTTKAYLNDACEKIYQPQNVVKIWPPCPSSVMMDPTASTLTWPLENKLPLPSTHFADVVLRERYGRSPE